MTSPRRAQGIVLRGTGGVWQVRTDTGETCPASLRGRLKQAEHEKLAVGDDVIVERDESDDAWTIVEILPRRSKLARRAPGGGPGERVVAANLDQVVVVFAIANEHAEPPDWHTLARLGHLRPRHCDRRDAELFGLFQVSTLHNVVHLLFAAVGGFDATVWGADDWDLWVRLLGRYRGAHLRHPVLA